MRACAISGALGDIVYMLTAPFLLIGPDRCMLLFWREKPVRSARLFDSACSIRRLGNAWLLALAVQLALRLPALGDQLFYQWACQYATSYDLFLAPSFPHLKLFRAYAALDGWINLSINALYCIFLSGYPKIAEAGLCAELLSSNSEPERGNPPCPSATPEETQMSA